MSTTLEPMTTILNITWNGASAETDVNLAPDVSDRDVKRIAIELVRTGAVPGLHVQALPPTAFDDFVVDRFDTAQGGRRLYLRPKVPFGAGPR